MQNCQEYLRTFSSSISPSALAGLPTPTNIVVIGCGDPSLIPFYAETSSCSYPIYADPSRKLYESLGMTSTKSLGPKRPAYQQRSLLSICLESVVQILSRGRRGLQGGDFWQVGGEFLVTGSGESCWCHRMDSTRGHTDVPELRKVLGLDRSEVPVRSKRWSTVSLGDGFGERGSFRRTFSARSKSWGRRRSAENSEQVKHLAEEDEDEKVDSKVPSSEAVRA